MGTFVFALEGALAAVDGDLDLLLMGDAGTNLITRIYRNDHGAFTELDVGLPGMSLGSAAWGDADGDGWLDLLLAGSTNRGQSGARGR